MGSTEVEIAKGYWGRPYSNPDFLESEGGEAKNCLSPDAVGASFFRAPGDFKKSLDLNKALIFWSFFFINACPDFISGKKGQ
jgi:hypothetical protein